MYSHVLVPLEQRVVALTVGFPCSRSATMNTPVKMVHATAPDSLRGTAWRSVRSAHGEHDERSLSVTQRFARS
jgi:hypothetical protein